MLSNWKIPMPNDEPPKPARKPHTNESLKALGFRRVPPSGKGYGLPHGPTPAAEGEHAEQVAPKTPTERSGLPTLDELRARGWTVSKPSGKGVGLPLHGPRPAPKDDE
jgi:hypothetical protein